MALQIDEELLKLKLQKGKEGAHEYQKRRHNDWTENYQLYRDKVITDRIKQRQTVNIPLMKETGRTILARIDDQPDVSFMDRGNDKQKEIIIAEYWKEFITRNNVNIKDVADKKQEFLTGRSHYGLNIEKGFATIRVIDNFDLLIDRYTDPTDLETASYVCQQHIFKPISELETRDYYRKDTIESLKAFYGTALGLKKVENTMQTMAEKNQRMESLGDTTANDPVIGETYVELNQHFIKLYDPDKKKMVWHLVTTCNDLILRDLTPLKEVLGVDELPFEGWADDVEHLDYWSDGGADIVRIPNKVVNAWYSQLTENRTLRNLGMRYYNSTFEGFVPQTYKPGAWAWLPVPGDPNQIIKDVDIPALTDSFAEMNFVIQMAERATAATATEKGMLSNGQVTLGEVKMAQGKALERITYVAKFYRAMWTRLAAKWYRIVSANTGILSSATLYKKSSKGNYMEKKVKPSDFLSDKGYEVIVTSSSEQEQESKETVQNFVAVKSQMPDNPVLDLALKKKLVGLLHLTPEQEKGILDFEKQKQEKIQEMMRTGGAGGVMPPGAGAPPPGEGQPTPEMMAAMQQQGAPVPVGQ